MTKPNLSDPRVVARIEEHGARRELAKEILHLVGRIGGELHTYNAAIDPSTPRNVAAGLIAGKAYTVGHVIGTLTSAKDPGKLPSPVLHGAANGAVLLAIGLRQSASSGQREDLERLRLIASDLRDRTEA